MAASDFSVGQTVKYVGHLTPQLDGKVGTVTEVREDEVVVNFQDDHIEHRSVVPDSLADWTNLGFKIGDKVKITGTEDQASSTHLRLMEAGTVGTITNIKDGTAPYANIEWGTEGWSVYLKNLTKVEEVNEVEVVEEFDVLKCQVGDIVHFSGEPTRCRGNWRLTEVNETSVYADMVSRDDGAEGTLHRNFIFAKGNEKYDTQDFDEVPVAPSVTLDPAPTKQFGDRTVVQSLDGPTDAEVEVAYLIHEAKKEVNRYKTLLESSRATADRYSRKVGEIRDYLISIKEEKGWCTPGFNRHLEEMGLDPLYTEFTVEGTVTFNFSVIVEADSEDEASENVAENIFGFTSFGRHDTYDVEVDSVYGE